MIPQLNSIVFDVIVIVMLLTFIAIGVFKGFKHTSINGLLLIGSVMISFTSLTNVIKNPIVSLLEKCINIDKQIGLSVEVKMGVSLLYNLIATAILTILIYLLLRVIKYVIYLSIRHHRKLNRANSPRMQPLSRIFGGIISLLVHGSLAILFISVLDNPMVGLNKTIDKSYVSKYVVRSTDSIISMTNKNVNEVKNELLIKTIKGDFFYKTSSNQIKDITEIGKTIDKDLITNTKITAENGQDYIDLLHGLLDLQNTLLNKSKEVNKFESLLEFNTFNNLLKEEVNKQIIAMVNNNTTATKISGINGTTNVYNLLNIIYGKDLASKFETMFILG